ncbi:hypothetical protein PQO01_14190 [Lentisphaera marina]|uniref:DUF6746 family protein n=1 Tax=Lentisphaera marina TaxID=1111041 RepID=UPI002365B19D|nr:DUF6746 family protein [Lentisphaera marina]MDD7986098.1 hypothetical protein [Lentisphaera marina]
MKKLFISTLLVATFMSCKQEEVKAPVVPAEVKESVAPSVEDAKKPVQHLKIADISSMDNAIKVFNETVEKLKSKNKFDAAELHDIHMITYSTEKAIAYFSENLTAEQKEIAKKAAVVLEEVHLASESNNKEATQKNLTEFLSLAAKIAINLK